MSLDVDKLVTVRGKRIHLRRSRLDAERALCGLRAEFYKYSDLFDVGYTPCDRCERLASVLSETHDD